MILITRPRKNSLEFQKRLEKLNINSEIQELSKFEILKAHPSVMNQLDKRVKLAKKVRLVTIRFILYVNVKDGPVL